MMEAAGAAGNNEEMVAELRNSVKVFDKTRRALEAEAEGISCQLLAPSGIDLDGPPMGLDTPLVDADGYPRGDIDIYLARTLRGRLAVIKTDHKALMKEIEATLQHLSALKTKADDTEETKKRSAPKPKPKFDRASGKWVVKNWDGSVSGVPGGDQRSFDALEASTPSVDQLHSLKAAAGIQIPPASSPRLIEQSTIHEQIPFARIDSVALFSPAESAGFRSGDLVLRFGSIVDASAFSNLVGIVSVASAVGGFLRVVVLRGESTLELMLKPQMWPGAGLVGCHIVPYNP